MAKIGMKITNGKSMIKRIALITCAMLLGLPGPVFLSLIYAVGLVAYVTPLNVFLIFPLSMFHLYACFTGRRYRFFIGLAIVIAYLFPVAVTANYPDGPDTIYLARDVFGSEIDFVMFEKTMPWHFLELYRDPRGLIIMFVPLILGFALIESGGWCFRKARVGSPSPKARVAVKVITLLLVNAINLTMLAALAGLVSKGDTTWGYLVYFLSVWAVGTILLALFIWFKPTWRWWIAMLPSIVILYVMPFLIGAHLNDRGEIVSPWNKGDDRAVEAPNLPDSHKSNNPNWVDPAARSEADYPVTPLMLAAGDGTPKEVKSQLARGIDIHAKNVYGTNALMYAALAGKSENIKVLLAAGARVNDQDDKGNTALSLARQQGHQEAVALLVAAGAKDMPLKP